MIPDGWVRSHLVEILDGKIKNGYSPNAADVETGYWVLSLGVLGDNGCNFKEIKPVYPTSQVIQNLLCADDFLISRSNTPDKVGRSMRFKGELSNCSYPDLMIRFRVDTKKADLGFIEAKLKSAPIRSYFKSCAAGSSSTMVKINKTVIEKIPLLLPPLHEQKKIAEVLSTWDKAISTSEKLLANSEQRKKALMGLLLAGKKRFPGFYEPWKKVRLHSLLIEEKTRNKDKAIKRVLSVTNHSGFVLPETQFSKRIASNDISNYKVIKNGQFGYNPSRINVGSFARLEEYEVGILSPMYVVFYTDENKLNGNYFLEWMSSSEANQRILSNTQGSVRAAVGFDVFCSFSLKLPMLSEQIKIAKALSSFNQEIEFIKQKITLLKQEKLALMQQLLTGKLRVKFRDGDTDEK